MLATVTDGCRPARPRIRTGDTSPNLDTVSVSGRNLETPVGRTSKEAGARFACDQWRARGIRTGDTSPNLDDPLRIRQEPGDSSRTKERGGFVGNRHGRLQTGAPGEDSNRRYFADPRHRLRIGQEPGDSSRTNLEGGAEHASRATSGAPERIRTSDLRLRRPSLYPAELRARGKTPLELRNTQRLTRRWRWPQGGG